MTLSLEERVQIVDNLQEFRRRCELAEITWEMLPQIQTGNNLPKLADRLILLMDVWHDSLPLLDEAIKLLEDELRHV